MKRVILNIRKCNVHTIQNKEYLWGTNVYLLFVVIVLMLNIACQLSPIKTFKPAVLTSKNLLAIIAPAPSSRVLLPIAAAVTLIIVSLPVWPMGYGMIWMSGVHGEQSGILFTCRNNLHLFNCWRLKFSLGLSWRCHFLTTWLSHLHNVWFNFVWLTATSQQMYNIIRSLSKL